MSLRGHGKRIILPPRVRRGRFLARRHFRSPVDDPELADGDIVINTLPLRQAAIAGAAILFGLPSALATETPTTQDLVHATASGSYLAARHAGTERDSATAAAYYLNVLKADPRNADLLGRTFLSVVTDGDIEEAGKLADRLIQVDRNDRIARLVVVV